MFKSNENYSYEYVPILAISPAEMTALEELPEKDRDDILPLFRLKGWVGSKVLARSIERIEKALGDRYWIADLDQDFLKQDRKQDIHTGEYSREVFYEVQRLLESDNGYDNWCNYIAEMPNAIPTVQIKETSQIKAQVIKLASLGKGIVVKFHLQHINEDLYLTILKIIAEAGIDDVFIIYDFEQIAKNIVNETNVNNIAEVVNKSKEMIPNAQISISSTSFPDSFSRYVDGENPIYERLLFNKVNSELEDINLVYSDRGSTRALKIGGGGGVPPPRIDYPLKHDWRFVRKAFLPTEDRDNPSKEERTRLYAQAAKTIFNSDYWIDGLDLWGTKLIKFTAKGEDGGIDNALKSTAVRINIHLYTQLHYSSTPAEFFDTDEDWVD